MINISKAAKLSGLPVKTVRYYADIELVKSAGRSAAGYRLYDDATLRRLTFVRRSREFGFSVENCRELLGLYENDERSSADVKKVASQRLKEIEHKQRELQLLREELSFLVKSCRGDDKPDCPIIDYLK